MPTDADGKGKWLAGGSYLVARRINMTVEIWDRQPLSEQEQVFGRTKAEGAPLTGGGEFSQPDFELSRQRPRANCGRPTRTYVWCTRATMAEPKCSAGATTSSMGVTALGRMDAGLFFLAYVRDPRTQFIPIQTKLGLGDRLSEYVQHTGSALFAIPPGIAQGEYVGQGLFT